MKCEKGIYNIKKQRETNQMLRSFIILGWKYPPNQTPVIPTKGVLTFLLIFTLTPLKANKATKKAGPSIQGRGNRNTLNIIPPNKPIKSVFKKIIKYLSLRLIIK